MEWIVRYDAWCLHLVEALLKWLDAWLSISQKRAEQGMIVLYVFFTFLAPGWTFTSLAKMSGMIVVNILSAFIVLYTMWILHKRPAVMRKASNKSLIMIIGRSALQAMMLVLTGAIIFASPHLKKDVLTVSEQIEYLVFFYSTCITFDGEPGRGRKLALAELKKMFGTEWIPKPLPVPR
jgi:hypothetical protein